MTIQQTDAWIFAALSELAYRRATSDFALDIEGINQGLQEINELENPFANTVLLENSLITFLEGSAADNNIYDFTNLVDGANSSAFGFNVHDSGDGVFHIWNELGFSAFIVQQGSEFIITFRGTDVSALNQDGFLLPALQATFGDGFQDVGQIGDDPNHVDEGDFFTNIRLGLGTTVTTQYDYALALTSFVIQNLAGNDASNVTVTGQSLGGGLATLVGAELGASIVAFGAAPFANQLSIIAEKNAALEIIADNMNLFEGSSVLELTDLELGAAFARAVNELSNPSGSMMSFVGDVNVTTLIQEFIAVRNTFLSTYNERINDGFLSTVEGEFTTTIGNDDFDSTLRLATHGLTSEFISSENADQVFNLGQNLSDFIVSGNNGGVIHPRTVGELVAPEPDVAVDFITTVNNNGEGSVRHSPALNTLLSFTENNADIRSFSNVLEGNNYLRFALFHTPGLAGSLIEDKIGDQGDPGRSLGGNLGVEPLYRLLLTSALNPSSTDDFYNYFVSFTDVIRNTNSLLGSDGVDRDTDPTQQNLHNAVLQFALQIIRDALNGQSNFTDFSNQLNADPLINDGEFAGNFEGDGYITLSLDSIVETDNRFQEAFYESIGSTSPDSYAAYGYSDLAQAIFDRIEDATDTETASELTHVEVSAGFVDYTDFVSEFASELNLIIVQTEGTENANPPSVNINLSNHTSGGAAIFLGEGLGSTSRDSSFIEGTTQQDFLLLSNSNEIVNGNGGDDVIIAGGGDDRITIVSSDNNRFIHAGDDNDTIIIEITNDTSRSGNTTNGTDDRDRFFGGEGEDTIDYSGLDEAIEINTTSLTNEEIAEGDILVANDGNSGEWTCFTKVESVSCKLGDTHDRSKTRVYQGVSP